MAPSGATRSTQARGPMMDGQPSRFPYPLICGVPGCGRTATHRLVAEWSDGTSRERKNYGLSCDDHLEAQLERGRSSRANLFLPDGELIGEVCSSRLSSL